MSNSDSGISSNIIIAKWTDRFLAWLIDFIIVSIISTSIIFTSFGTIDYGFGEDVFWAESIRYIPTSIVFFTYWTILEYKISQTIGEKILNLKIVNINGKKPDLTGIMISSFGKSFLLPIDVALGWFLTNEKRQRIFNKLGDTLVVKIKESESTSDIRYAKD
ncbi:MAG TPA: RDD family protein [Nitrosopumilus sp.]|nr:RDD family protein [Thermoproteota archaeon]HJJ23452.1 RDD family protein [Nitrosopumilus sp.]